MSFIKRATIIGSFYTGNQLDSLKNDWISIVKSGVVLPPFEEFDWEPDKFLYYRARAITADVPNQNGDYFPAEELEKSYHTFRGRGVYYNHDSDSPDKAFGIILDSVYIDTPNDKYIQILAAIDKEAIEQKRPGLLAKIVQGKLNTTSMSCLVSECICSLCGNIATEPSGLCKHMDPKSPYYVKGKTVNGNKVYEINKGITFIEDSIVDVPADSTAYIFQVYASYIPEVTSERLKAQFQKYSAFKSYSKESSFDTLVETVIDKKIENKVKQLIDEQVRLKIDPLLQSLEQKVAPKIQPIVEQKVEERSDVIEKIPNLDGLPTTQPAEKVEKKEVKPVSESVSENVVRPKPSELEERPVKKHSFSSSESHFRVPDSDKVVLSEIPDIYDINGYTFKLFRDTYILKKDNETIGHVRIPKDFGKMPKKLQRKFFEDQLAKLTKTEKSTPVSGDKEAQIKMQGSYIKGSTFDDSYFVFTDGNDTIKVKASSIIPVEIQERILRDDPTVVHPEDIIKQISSMAEGSMKKLTSSVLPALVKNASLKNQSFTKAAEWSWSEEEIPSIKTPKPTDGPIVSVNSEEVPSSKNESGPSVKVKQYFSKLPTKGVGEPTQSINIQSSQDDIIKTKIELLKRALEEERKKKEEAEKELAVLKEKEEKRSKEDVIEEISGKIGMLSELEPDQLEKVVELLNKFAPPQLNILKQIFEILTSKREAETVDNLAGKSLGLPEISVSKPKPENTKKEASIPQIFISADDSELDILEIAQRSLEK